MRETVGGERGRDVEDPLIHGHWAVLYSDIHARHALDARARTHDRTEHVVCQGLARQASAFLLLSIASHAFAPDRNGNAGARYANGN